MAIARDPSCCRDLNWRVELPPDLALEVLEARLIAAGWRDVSTAAFMRVVESPEGHELVLVPRTRRAQLRLDYLVAPDARPQVADAIAAQIAACFSVDR